MEIPDLKSVSIKQSAPEGSIAAFFDFDETLLAIDSASIGFKVLKEQGYLSKAFMLKMMGVMLLKKFGIVNEQVMARTFLGFYKGRDLKPFVDSALDFYEGYLQPNLSPRVVQKLEWHQQEGHHTILVTGSIDYYLKPVQDDLGIDHLLCTHLEIGNNGLLTGRSKGPVCVGEAKVALMSTLVAKYDLNLSDSYAYGNSELDIPMLNQVGHPVIVNPTPGLLTYSKSKAWAEL